ncbi:hypothetical protein DL93DRAFT_2083752 [Clavulina sp. PMI_390]|nr:hypothetical protein DL93DRAFT_2083752 [Clavulina sp. PMI_390]
MPSSLITLATFLIYSWLVQLPLNIRSVGAVTYSATYLPYNAPKKSETGQTGTNQCGTKSSQDSECQNAYLNALDDFCLWAPPANTSSYGDSKIANTEQIEVAWCMRDGYGTRLIPPGAIKGAHFVRTPYYVQVTGVGDLTSMNIPKGDDGGELDPHGYDGLGNPIGGLVFGTPYNGTLRQFHEWTNFMSSNAFCFRVCPDGPLAPTYCEHIYDTLGCGWNMPGNYSEGFSSCEGDPTQPMGVYTYKGANGVVTTSTFHQGDPSTPSAHPAAKSSSCTYFATLSAYNDNAPAATPTASLLPSSVSASLSRVSVTSVAAVSSESTASVASVTSIASTSKPTGGSSPTSTTSSHTGAAPASIDRGSLLATLTMGLTSLLFGFWAISRI